MSGSHNPASRPTLESAVLLAASIGISAIAALAAPPSNLKAIPGNGIVSLVWQRPDTLRTETYNIYRSTTSGTTGAVPYAANVKTVTVPTCMTGQPYHDELNYLADFGDTGVTNGTTYCYQVTMVRNGVESAKTAEARATPVSASHAITMSRFLKIMPMGNSITEGWCGDNGYGSYNGGYRGPLYDTLTNAGYTFLMVGSCINCSPGKPFQYHEGYGSRTVQDILRTVIRRALASYDPDLILLEIGTNNFAWGGTDVNGALKAYDSLLAVITTLKPNLTLLVAPILPLPGNTLVTSYNAGVKKEVDSLAALGKHVAWVTEMASFPVSQLGDGVHPKEAAYPILSSAYFQAIKRVTDAASIVSGRDVRSRQSAAPTVADHDPASMRFFTIRGTLMSIATGGGHACGAAGRLTSGVCVEAGPQSNGVIVRKRIAVR